MALRDITEQFIGGELKVKAVLKRPFLQLDSNQQQKQFPCLILQLTAWNEEGNCYQERLIAINSYLYGVRLRQLMDQLQKKKGARGETSPPLR